MTVLFPQLDFLYWQDDIDIESGPTNFPCKMVSTGWCQRDETQTVELHITCTDSTVTGLILGLRPANERRRYLETMSLIGWVQT